MLETLVRPHYPKAALGISSQNVTALALQRQGAGVFRIRQAATLAMEEGVLSPSFIGENINDPSRFSAYIERAATECGMGGHRNWSVSLPSTAARTAIISISEVPASRSELSEVLDFKAETSFGVASDQLRISMEKLQDTGDGKTRYFASAIKLSVIDEYESVFEMLGWRAGLVLPKAVCELKWLVEAMPAGDSILISHQENGFTALLLRNGQPALVRSVTCRDDEIEDEIYRLLVYYQDKYSAGNSTASSARFLVIGEDGLDERLKAITLEALGFSIDILQPYQIGLELSPGSLNFSDVAAPAGIASFGF